MRVFIDLFCGLGGASEAFMAAPGWKVVRIDNNPILLEHTKGMWLLDVHETNQTYTTIQAHLLEHIDDIEQIVVWASPPCTEFSLVNPNRPMDPDLTLLLDGMTIRDMVRELAQAHGIEFLWAVENVKGAIPWFDDELECPWHQRIGPFFLWGSIPWIDFKDADGKLHRKGDSDKGTRALRPNMRALIPLDVSKSLLDTLENQTKLDLVFE